MTISEQVHAALDAATHENGYAHEMHRPALDILLEIHDWSGIEGFDPEDTAHLVEGVSAVTVWRWYAA